MNSRQASDAIAGGYIFNINLPAWKSPETAEVPEKKLNIKNLNIMAFGVLAAIVLGIVFIKKKK